MPSVDKRITYALYDDAFNVKQVGCQKNERTVEKKKKEKRPNENE